MVKGGFSCEIIKLIVDISGFEIRRGRDNIHDDSSF
jgi:hypothetical protein